MPIGRKNISIFDKTYKILLEKKLKFQSKVGKAITWDEFLLKHIGDE